MNGLMTGGELIAAQLAMQGIGSVFSVAGASHTFLLDALDRAGFAILSSRHESGAVGAADGYARAVADQRPVRPGVALIVLEQGLANAIGGLAVARAAGSPVLLLVAAPPRGHAETSGWIDHEQLALVAPVAKWARTVPSADRLGNYLESAIRAAISERPGPAVLVIPQDLFRAEARGTPAAICNASTAAPADQIAAAADILAAAERPLAIAGLGAFRGQAAAPLAAMCRSTAIPLLGNGSGRGLLAEDDMLGFSWPHAQQAARHADCIVMIGEQFSQRLGYGQPPRFAADAKFIQIDADQATFGRNRQVDIALAGDPGEIVTALSLALSARRKHPFPGWLPARLAQRVALIDRLASQPGPAIHPLALGRAIQARLPAEAMVIGDGADIQNWMYGALRVRRPGGFMDHYPLGAMGSGTALAVGAAAALAESAPAMTVLITGDGSIGFHPAELHAAALAGLNLKIIVGNDAAWGTEAHGQIAALGRTINTHLGKLPYARMAEGFGCTGLTCDTTDALESSLDQLFAAPGPALLDVRIDPAAGAELKSNPLASAILFSDIAIEDSK
jgi:acetolactate synthase I/II/III large subunit